MTWQQILIFCFVSIVASSINAAYALKGKAAFIEEVPYQVSLRSYERHFCGGTIVTEKHVVTAAHCFKSSLSPSWETIVVVSGTSYAKKKGNVHEIANITVNTGYKSDGNSARNDIAVITLTKAITFNKNQKKLNLPKNDYHAGDKAVVSGWGLTTQEPPNLPDKLQKLVTSVISSEECQKSVIDSKTTTILDTHVCSGRPLGAGICSGDSGGPMAVNDELVGVISWFDGDYCFGPHPNVYTNVYKYKDFIVTAIKETS